MIESHVFEALFEIFPFGVYVVDIKTYEVIYANRSYKNIHGDCVEKICYQEIYGEDSPCYHCKIPQLMSDANEPNKKTLIFERFNEYNERWYQHHEKTMCWPDGRIVKYSIEVDICELKEMQNRLAEAHATLMLSNKELIQTTKTLEDVQRMIQHNLKNPLGAIIGFPTTLLQDTNLTEKQRRLLGLIKTSGQRMLDMINQSVQLYKIELGNYHYEPQTINLIQLLNDILEEFIPLAQDYQVSFELISQFDENTRVLNIEAEENLCVSIFSNLLKNALEASFNEIVTITVYTNDDFSITQIHNKKVVPEAIRHKFFEKYITAEKPTGTGLGTYTAKLLTDIQQGKISMTSNEKEGTTLSVALLKAKPFPH